MQQTKNIPSSVRSIGENAFDSTPWLDTQIENAEDVLVIVGDGVLLDGTTYLGETLTPYNNGGGTNQTGN